MLHNKKGQSIWISAVLYLLVTAVIMVLILNSGIPMLNKLKDKIGSNVAGEGGEFESLVLNCPLFKKKLVIEEFEIKEESEYAARMIIKKASLK